MRNVANEQGLSEESHKMALTEQVKAWSTERFSASEADVLEEHKLLNIYASRTSVFERVQRVPSFQ
jgi:hypothetical protein